MAAKRDQMLYTRCQICNGTLKPLPGVTVADWPQQLGDRCICTLSPTPGYVSTGVTARQLERLVAAHCGDEER